MVNFWMGGSTLVKWTSFVMIFQQSFAVDLGVLGVCFFVAPIWCVHAPPFRWHFKNGHALCTHYRDRDTFISPFSFRLQEPNYQSYFALIPKNCNLL